MITWDDFDKIWASTSPLTPYSFSDPNYAQGWNFIGSTPPARQMWDSIQKQNDEKFKYLRDNFGTPNIVTQASQMTDTDKVYVYLGSEAGWNNGHWYYYDEGTSSWADGGVYNSVAFVTDTTLSIAGQPADAKATGDALALKSDLAGCTFTGNVSVNTDFSVTGDATIGTDLSVTGVSTLTGKVSAGADVTVVGDVSSANLTTSADATIGGDLSVTGTTSLTGNVTAGDVTANDVSVANINASNNGTIGGSLSVTGTSSLVGDVTASGDVNATGDVTADNISATTNGTIGGALSVAGASTLTGNVSAGADVVAVGDVSSANIIASNNANIGGNATVTGSVASASLTTTADGTIGGNLSVSGTTTLTGDVSASADLIVAGDSSLTNLSVSGTTALAGTSTAPTPSADDNSTKIATTEYVQTEIKPIETDVNIADKRISNMEKLLQGNLYDYQTDSDSKYVKSVPAGAMPYAGLEKVGGKTVVWNQLVNSGTTSVATISGHKYYTVIDGTAIIVTADGTAITVVDDTADMVCDLTLMFGSGNEPSTTADFSAIFGATHYPYNAGTLLSAGVTEVESVGKNLLDISQFAKLYPNDCSWNESTQTLTINNANSATLFATGIAVSYPAGYVAKANITNITSTIARIDFVYNDGTASSTSSNSSLTFLKPVVKVRLNWSNGGVFTIQNAQVENNSTSTAYTPYMESTIPIPTAIRNIEGYGWSAGQVYNYVDFERKVFVQNVGSIVIDGVNRKVSPWGSSYPSKYFIRFITRRFAISDKFIYTGAPVGTMAEMTFMGGSGISPTWSFALPSTVTTTAEANAWFEANPTTIYYPLDTPIETDISAYITDDNLIEVEAGGTLTFPNQNGTDYQIPVPSAETYMVDLQEAVSNG